MCTQRNNDNCQWIGGGGGGGLKIYWISKDLGDWFAFFFLILVRNSLLGGRVLMSNIFPQ
jgi:hypothetical protein